MESPSIWHDNEDMIFWKLWWLFHDSVVKATSHFSGARKQQSF
jgi:hypothetical protein